MERAAAPDSHSLILGAVSSRNHKDLLCAGRGKPPQRTRREGARPPAGKPMAPGQQSTGTLPPATPEQRTWAGGAGAAGLGQAPLPPAAGWPSAPRAAPARRPAPGLTAGRASPAASPGSVRARLGLSPATDWAAPGHFHARAGAPHLRREPGSPAAEPPLPSLPGGSPAGGRRPGEDTFSPGAGGLPLRARPSPDPRGGRRPAPGSHVPRGPRRRGTARVRGTLTLDGALAGGAGRQQQHLAPLLGGHR